MDPRWFPEELRRWLFTHHGISTKKRTFIICFSSAGPWLLRSPEEHLVFRVSFLFVCFCFVFFQRLKQVRARDAVQLISTVSAAGVNVLQPTRMTAEPPSASTLVKCLLGWGQFRSRAAAWRAPTLPRNLPALTSRRPRHPGTQTEKTLGQ